MKSPSYSYIFSNFPLSRGGLFWFSIECKKLHWKKNGYPITTREHALSFWKLSKDKRNTISKALCILTRQHVALFRVALFWHASRPERDETMLLLVPLFNPSGVRAGKLNYAWEEIIDANVERNYFRAANAWNDEGNESSPIDSGRQ